MHKLYVNNPPHDNKLYEILEVSSNATSEQIAKSYRRLSRQYHPDKGNQPEKLQEVQASYNILKDDSTRLPYHQYGLSDPNVAVAVLLGPHHPRGQHLLDEAHHELLQLMGYEHFNNGYYWSENGSLDAKSRREQRIRYVAARLVERLRPLVEESISPHWVAHRLAHECDEWKRLPMGAQIIRCVGRAYRHAGRDYLQKHTGSRTTMSSTSRKRVNDIVDQYSVPVRQQWRKAKAFWTAVFAAGKATVTEQVVSHQEKKHQRLKEKATKKKASTPPSIDYHTQGLGRLNDEDDEEDVLLLSDISDSDDEEERKLAEHLRARQTLLTSLQVEALWKVAKIDLDAVILGACHLILTQEYFFFPSHQTTIDDNRMYSGGGEGGGRIPSEQGWVTRTGRLMDANDGLVEKTAEALCFLGDIMVTRSKTETAWKD